MENRLAYQCKDCKRKVRLRIKSICDYCGGRLIRCSYDDKRLIKAREEILEIENANGRSN